MEYKNILAIDPGLHTGLAYFPGKTIVPETMDFNVDYKARTTAEKLNSLIGKLSLIWNDSSKYIEHVVIEGVSIYSGSVKSMTAATRGNLSLLSYIVGAYYCHFISFGCEIDVISPQWKGQLNYNALDEWVYQINGQHYKSEHIRAAAGLGLWKKGLIK